MTHEFMRLAYAVRVDNRNLLTLRYGELVSPGGRRSPSPELGAELRRLREAASLTAAAAALAMGWAESTLSRKELGQIGITDADLDGLATLYAAGDEVRESLRRLATGADRRPPRSRRSRNAALPGAYEEFVGLEERASELSSFSSMVVPSLLQTPEYAAAIIGSTPVPEDEYVRPRVVTRMVRQAVLGRDPPPRLNVILDASVLERRIGDRPTMRRQMLRLVEASERPNTTIQVLSLDCGAHPALSGTFAVLGFDDGTRPRVFCDGLTGGILRDDREDVQRYIACFQKLRGLALDSTQSLDLFQRAADNYAQ
jgi:transcriptional regulator with XRE-family HTH domain